MSSNQVKTQVFLNKMTRLLVSISYEHPLHLKMNDSAPPHTPSIVVINFITIVKRLNWGCN